MTDAPSRELPDVVQFLTEAGMPPRIPPVRSSYVNDCLDDPFYFYLTTILGITHRFSISDALTRGSWLHKAFEYIGRDKPEIARLLHDDLEQRLCELRSVAEEFGIDGLKLDEILNDEREDFNCATGWMDAALNVHVGDMEGTLSEFLLRPSWRVLGKEALFILNEGRGLARVIQVDRLMYDEATNAVWILDPKTCPKSAKARLSICPVEFGTRHYVNTLTEFVRNGMLQTQFDLPKDVQVGGMIHIAIQKPTIKMCDEDRDFVFFEHTLTRGPRKGEVEVRKEFKSAEPTHANYVARCARWYLGQGEYEKYRAERSADPPVNLSYTSANSVYDEEAQYRYNTDLSLYFQMAYRTPAPINFRQNAQTLNRHGNISKFAPFYTCPIEQWPEIMVRDGFTVRHRDADITPETETQIRC